MRRRKFIQSSSLVTLPLMLKGIEVTAIQKSSLASLINPHTDKVLVLVQLNGGNDGLNTFIPLDQYDNLVKARENIILPESSLIKVSDMHSFHPAMTGFEALYKEGKMGVVQSVSYPNQNRSHFRSTDIWTSGSDSDEFITTGWLGRHFDLQYPGYPDGYPSEEFPDPFAITLGFVVSETCQGNQSNFSYATTGADSLSQLSTTVPGVSDDTCYGMELDYVREVVSQSNAYSTVVGEAFEKGSNMVEYPDNSLAEQLKIVSNLVAGGLQTKVYVVSLGGFDTHANQVVGGDPLNGEHTELMTILSSSIEAFQKDLAAHGLEERVIGMTFSEFGRRIKSNDGFGTDHGTAAPLFVFGSCVNGGVFGENPEITDQVADNEGVAMQYDFRSIYATILMDWFEVDEEQVRAVLFDEFQYIPFLKDCATVSGVADQHDLLIEASISPNPVSNTLNVSYKSNGGIVMVQLYDAVGSLIKVVSSRRMSSAIHKGSIDVSSLPSGIYYLRIQEGGAQKSIKFIKG